MHASGPLPLLVDPAWLEARLGEPDLVILDSTIDIERDPAGDRIVPARATFEAGHIPGAQFINVQRDLSDRSQALWFMLPPADDFARSMERLGIGETSRVVIYSTGSVWWATRVWWVLRAFGLENAAILDGGWAAWTREGRPVEIGPGRKPAAGRFPPRAARRLTADKAAVLAAIGDPAVCTVNALSAASHTGAAPSHYGRSGHIKGSVNVPGADLIDAKTNRFLPVDAIGRRLRAAGVLDAERVISYCGGGITATMIAFSLALLGRPDPLIYDASLQEWAPDAALPIEVG